MSDRPVNRIVVDVQPHHVPFLGGKKAPGILVELADGEQVPLVFPDTQMYGAAGLVMFLDTLPDDTARTVEQMLIARGIIEKKPEAGS